VTAGFALLTAGAMMIFTAFGDMSLADIMRGAKPNRSNLIGSDLGLGSVGAAVTSAGSAVTGTVKGVSKSYQSFSRQVAAGTGLSVKVIGAWCLAEGGPNDNPLNIGPGNHYGSVSGAAKATIKLLRTSTYKNVMRSAGKSDRDQIAAIAASPWCPGCAGYEQLLLGTYERVS